MKKHTALFFLAIIFIFNSCNKEEYKAPVSNTVNMAGKWWVELLYDDNKDGIYNEDDGDALIYTYADFEGYGIVTSNTAANDVDSIWINDFHDSWPFKIKAPINYSNLTVSPATIPNVKVDGETVTIISGKILKNAARSKSGAVVDSIFVEFEFSDDLGSYYIYSGHRDTGQPEDQFE